MIGLYIAYVIPIFLRWRHGRRVRARRRWNLGNKWRWMNPFAVIWVIDHHDHLLPAVHAGGMPWNTTGADGDGKFDWKDVNYAPITVLVVMHRRRHLVEGQRPQVLHRPGRGTSTSRSSRRGRSEPAADGRHASRRVIAVRRSLRLA